MTHNYKRFEGETDQQLIFRICQDKEVIGTWRQVADILNDLLGENSTESRYRKAYQYYNKMLVANEDKIVDDKVILEDIKEQRRELEKAKVRFRDERNEYNRQNRVAARAEQRLDYLEEKLSEIGKIQFKNTSPVTVNGDNDLLVCVNDTHIGETNANFFGCFDTEIAKERLGQYLEEIIEIQKRHNSRSATVALLGDLLSGNIHLTIQVTNRENVIDQIKIVSELLSSFVHELSQYFDTVNICSVSGNHSRMANKDEALKDERLDDLVMFIMEKTLSNVDNILFEGYANLDTGLAMTNIRGKLYVLVHGDYDTPTETGIMKLCSMIGVFPEAIIMGHRHSPAYSEFNRVKVVQSGCLSGSGGDYCIQKRLSGIPSQTVCVCTEKGIICTYPVNLS